MRCSHEENWWLSCLLCLFLAAVVRCPRCLVFCSWFSPVLRVVSITFPLGSTRFLLLRRSLVALDDSVFHVLVYVEC